MRQMKRCIAVCLAMAFILGWVPVLWAENVQDLQKVNINQASVEELTQLHRIGAKYAQRIVTYRDEHGPFAAPEDLMKVPGIGARVYEENKDRISVE